MSLTVTYGSLMFNLDFPSLPEEDTCSNMTASTKLNFTHGCSHRAAQSERETCKERQVGDLTPLISNYPPNGSATFVCC